MIDQIISPLASVSHISLMQRPYGPRVHMDENTVSAPAVSEVAADLPADAPEEFASASEAAAYFTGLQEKRKEPPAERADPATADKESPVEGDADPEKDPGETEEVEAEKDPPIDRPKSWSKDEDAEWQSLPRAMQQKIVARELERDTGTVRSQQEAANARKAAEAVQAQAEQARQQYEAHAKSALAVLEREQLRDFPDIKNLDDIRNLAANDPFRYLQWDAHQKDMAAAQFAAKEAEGRQNTERQKQALDRKAREHTLLIEKAPEFAEPAKLTAAQQAAVQLFRDKGFSDDELNSIGDNPLLDDHRMQLIINDALKYRDIQKAPKAIAAKPLPPVLRPGTSRPSGQGANSERIQALNRKPELTLKEATELVTLQQSSQRRAP